MVIRLSVDSNGSERMLLDSVIGLLEALVNEWLTIDECENYLFNPYSVSVLEGENINFQILKIIELGC